MSDVEKYGVFALVFVMGVLGLIVFNEPDADQGAAAAGGQSVIIRTSSDVPLNAGLEVQRRKDRGQPSLPESAGFAGMNPRSRTEVAENAPNARHSSTEERAAHYRVRSPTDGAGSFDFAEPPLRYPGERTTLGRASTDGSIVHVVRKGETLMDISKTYYGTTGRWRDIQKLNPKLVPERLRPGDEIVVSKASAASARPAPVVGSDLPRTGERLSQVATPDPGTAPRTYVVQKGDTLGQIAQRLLGSVKRVNELYAANSSLLASPHDLKIGMELAIP